MYTNSVIKHFESKDTDVSAYFDPSLELIENGYDWDVIISFMFTRLEKAQTDTLVFGIMKLHKVDGDLTRRVVERKHFTRKEFREYFASIYGKKIPVDLVEGIENAEKIRDKIMHGKKVADKEKRIAVVEILDYFEGFNELVFKVAGFYISGSMQGFKGRALPLDKNASRWMLKGMGFEVS